MSLRLEYTFRRHCPVFFLHVQTGIQKSLLPDLFGIESQDMVIRMYGQLALLTDQIHEPGPSSAAFLAWLA